MSQVVTGAARAGASPGGPKIRRAAATDARDGPLPMLLLTLTIVTGIIDAVSILSLGHVFVANMTGNLVFTGFAAVGTPGFSAAAVAVALAGFVAGALGGSRLAQRWAGHRGHLLRNTTTMEFVLVGAMMTLSIVVPHPLPCGRDLMLIVLGAAMGGQSAAMRRIGVPGLPTANVVTTTLTGLLADIAAARPGPYLGRRMAALAAITGGAALGAVLVLHASPATALGAATGLLALVSAAAHRLSPGAPDRSRPPQP
jgi:uncharacterized membrane protein YoaK (UPF0700 family)